MSITVRQANSLIRAISDFTAAAVAESWKGGGDPAEVPDLEAQLERQRKRLQKLIQSLVASSLAPLTPAQKEE